MKNNVKILENAQSIFLEGLENDTNVQAGFICELTLAKEDLALPHPKTNVLVAARSFYRLYVNGRLCAHGPARAASGYLRIDDIDVTKYVKEGPNVFAFEVTSYGNPFGGYANDTVLGPGLLRAAIISGEKEVLSSPATFAGIRLTQRVQYAERISHCRAMTEIYDLDDAYTAWRTDRSLCADKVAAVPDGSVLIGRGSPLPTLKRKKITRFVTAGRAEIDDNVPFEDNWFERSIGFYKDLAERPLRDYVRTVEQPLRPGDRFSFTENGAASFSAEDGEPASFYFEYDLGTQEVGFIDVTLETSDPCTVDIIHLESQYVYCGKDEISGGANPVTRIRVQGGRISFTSMEPMIGRYFKVIFRGCASAKLLKLAVRQYTTPETRTCGFLTSDDNVNRLFEAAALTFRLNTLDIFMDCPERERGGWLCDSYWTGRAERMIPGGHKVERDFIENFLLTDASMMWRGFFPECYPSNKSSFSECAGITTWSFWLMLELCEYAKETNDIEFAEKHRQRIEAFVDGFKTLIGPTGLLENLPWCFIDWSLSNEGEYLTPVSTAANALASKMMRNLGELYGRDDWKELGDNMCLILREAILRGGTPGKGPAFIPDAFNIADGRLVPKERFTESCAYLTVWSGIIDKTNAPLTLFNIVRAMGPCPEFNPHPRVGRAGLFIGLQYRFDMLAKLGEYDTLFRELNTFYGAQLREGPGTLWENPDIRCTSYCHGFTSFAAVQLLRDILGIGIPDARTKTVKIDPHPCGLRWARGSVMTPEGLIAVSWVDRGGELEVRVSLPEGWKRTV
ncbi:MAG: hypothetical protein IJS71_02865 [Clostridia bacterium]|nr:hypothetical protein [Clostridia bacterium]